MELTYTEMLQQLTTIRAKLEADQTWVASYNKQWSAIVGGVKRHADAEQRVTRQVNPQ